MGKRELLIAVAFVIAGVIAYQIEAPPPKPGSERFSISRLWNSVRRGVRGDAAKASTTTGGTLPAPSRLSELRLDGAMRQVRVVGESRADIAYELAVESTGADQETAMQYARQVAPKVDDLGSTVTLRVTYPSGGRQAAAMTLHVPSRLSLAFAGSSGVEAAHVASVLFDNVSGDATISDVPGALSGGHRNGLLAVRDVGSVKLTLQRSRATFTRIGQGLSLEARGGECQVTDSKGALDLDETGADVTVTNHAGPIRIGGNDGRVTLKDPREASKVDVRRAEIEVSVSRAVPLTLLTTDDTLRVLLDGPPPVTIDAVSNLGRIQADDFGLKEEVVDQERRISHAFGGATGARVSLRNLRGDIVIRNARRSIEKPIGK
jgi:hypothetical protein